MARAVLGTRQAYDYIYSFWSDQYEHTLEYVGFARKWERIVLRGDYSSRKFLAFYLTQGILQAAFGLNRGGDPELDPDAELRTCQDLIRGRIQLSEASCPGGRPCGPAIIEHQPPMMKVDETGPSPKKCVCLLRADKSMNLSVPMSKNCWSICRSYPLEANRLTSFGDGPLMLPG